MSDTPTFLTGTELLLQELTAERAKVAALQQECARIANERALLEVTAQREKCAAEAKVARLRDFVVELADEDCQYGDNCTDDAMRMRRHYRCLNCKAREALREAS